jgi:hypothetical protein
MRHIGDHERLTRLATRHAIAPGARVGDPVAAARAVVALHSTEPATVYLSLAARVDGLTVADVDRALFEDRTLVKQLAMRRTLFTFPRDLLPAVWASASTRVADQQVARLAKELEQSGITKDGRTWIESSSASVLGLLGGEERGLTTMEIRAALPELSGTVSISPGTKWGGDIPIGPRLLTLLGARGAIIRGRNDGHWRLSRHAWTITSHWLDDVPEPLDTTAGYAELVRRWLAAFGPGTVTDLKWWLGSTVTVVKQALADVEAVEVSLDGGGAGWVLPDDVDAVDPVDPWAALLPVLDATTMGWKERDFYLDPEHTPYLFDSNGNGGTTAWWNGRIVGCWVQDEAAVVRVVLREDVGADGRAALDVEAERLTNWLDGIRIGSVYQSLQMKSALLP